MDNFLFETYKNYVMPHGRHIYVTEYDMDMATTCAYPPPQHSLPHCKYVLSCCINLPCIHLPGQESDMHHSNTSPSMIFKIYPLTSRCTLNVRLQLDKKKICHLCLQILDSVPLAKLHTRKELGMMETYISDFHISFYIK